MSSVRASYKLRMFSGPSLLAPFTAVVIEFPVLETPIGQSAWDGEKIEIRVPTSLSSYLRTFDPRQPIEHIVAKVALALHDYPGLPQVPCRAGRTAERIGRVCLGYYDREHAARTLVLAYRIAVLILIRSYEKLNALAATTAQYADDKGRWQAARAARSLGIPAYRLAGSEAVQYGQGTFGLHFRTLYSLSNQFDASSGLEMQHFKDRTNQFVRQLGFPSTEYELVDGLEKAQIAGRKTGFPLVVKPVNGSKSRGVTVCATEGAIPAAFSAANAISPGKVLIERFVEGKDYRLVVSAKRFLWARHRAVAHVIGDGMRTIADLIVRENAARVRLGVEVCKILSIDQTLMSALGEQKLTLDDIPPAEQIVKLAPAYHSATGIVRDDTASIHPDNREMAEAVARCMRLDLIGLDFITPDISRSWRDVPCAIIEVNASPGMQTDAHARVILQRCFPPDSIGRIPSVLVVSRRPSTTQDACALIQQRGWVTGYVREGSSGLDRQARPMKPAALADRALALVLDPTCECIIIACTQDEIADNGLPLDRVSLCVVDPDTAPDAATLTLLRQNCDRFIDHMPVVAAVEHWLATEAVTWPDPRRPNPAPADPLPGPSDILSTKPLRPDPRYGKTASPTQALHP